MSKNSLHDGLRSVFSYCVQQVRKYDYQHYLCLLNLPTELRPAAFALRAFNVETAKVKESARDINLAKMRLVWWRDAIDGMYKNNIHDHPVLKALGSVTSQHRLSKHWFSRIISARMADVEMPTSPKDITELENYAESTASMLLYLTLEAAGIRNTSADHAASHIGKADGLTLLLQSTSFHSSHRMSYIPLEVAARHGISQEDIYRGKQIEKLQNAVYEIAAVANTHLETARQLRTAVPPAALPILLPAVPTGVLLSTLQHIEFNPFDPKVNRGVCGVSPLWMQLKLKWHAIRGTY